MKSMTGYGRATAAIGSATLTVQVSSVNRKSLDITVSLPGAWDSLEPDVIAQVRSFASRGKVHVDIELSRQAGQALVWDEAVVSSVLDKLAAFADARGAPFSVTPELLWQIALSQRTGAEAPSAEACRPGVIASLAEALRSFAAMRQQEGGALLSDFLSRISLIRSHADAIGVRAPLVAPNYRDLLHKRLRDAGLELDLQDERVLREIALFADRCDVTEELTRFRSHLDQLTALLKGDAEIGRKADFILQELGREANTVGSKSNDLAISKSVIELKNELERVREQMANVE